MELQPGHSNGRQRHRLLKRSGVSHQRAISPLDVCHGTSPGLVMCFLVSVAPASRATISNETERHPCRCCNSALPSALPRRDSSVGARGPVASVRLPLQGLGQRLLSCSQELLQNFSGLSPEACTGIHQEGRELEGVKGQHPRIIQPVHNHGSLSESRCS